MMRSTALDTVRGVLGTIRGYVEEHDTIGDLEELNAKYVPTALQDDVAWLVDIVEHLLAANPHDPDHDDAVPAPPPPSAAT